MRGSQKRSIIERIAQAEGVASLATASDHVKFRIYKLTLREIGKLLENEDISKATLSSIKTALNDIENGFIYLLNRPKINKRDINIVKPKLIDAKAHLTTALTELGSEGKGKRFDYARALSHCKFLIGQIIQQLED